MQLFGCTLPQILPSARRERCPTPFELLDSNRCPSFTQHKAETRPFFRRYCDGIVGEAMLPLFSIYPSASFASLSVEDSVV